MGKTDLSLDNARNIEEIAAIMKEYNEVAKRAGWDIKSVLKDMYKDPSHFVFELLQNSEDVQATKIKIILYTDRFLFMHNGKDFELKDIKGVCKAGDSIKGIDQKGKFGIGFKAVYKITNTPKIYCNSFSFKIKEYNVPIGISINNDFEYDTLIELPFDTDIGCEKTYSLIVEGLKRLNESSIMFLDNIDLIEISFDGENKTLRKSLKGHIKHDDLDYYKLTTYIDDESKDYHLFRSTVKIENIKKNISIAYKIPNDNLKIIESNKLSVYFPTEQETFLRFLIDAPFETTHTREQVNINTEMNKYIFDEVLSLYCSSILYMKSKNILSLDMIYLLAINQDNESKDIYRNFYQKTIEIFNEKKLLPSYDGDYVKASDALLCRDNELFMDLLSKDDLTKMFDGRNKWINGEKIKTDRSDDIRAFLTKSLGVVDFEFNTFLPRIDDEFFLDKDDLWLMKFYKICINNVQNIKNNPKPIIRTSNNKMKSPFLGIRKNTRANVFLPSDFVRNNEKVIKPIFLSDETSMSFFKSLEIEEADIQESILLEWIPFMKTLEVKNDWVETLDSILLMIFNSPREKSENIVKELMDIKFIPTHKNNNKSEIVLSTPRETFISDSNLSKLFNKSNYCFLITEVQEIYNNKPHIQEIMSRLGVRESFVISYDVINWRYNFPEQLINRIKKEFPNDEISNQKTSRYIDYHIENFNEIINNLDEELSNYFWQKLVLLPIEYFSAEYEVQFKHHYEKAKGRFNSTLVNKLNSTKWIFFNGDKMFPKELTKNEFKSKYIFSNINLENLLEFKVVEDFTNLTEISRKKLEFLESRDMSEIELAMSLLDEKKRQERVRELKSNYLIDLFQNNFQISLLETEIDILSSLDIERFTSLLTLEFIFNILKKNRISINNFNEISDLKFDKVSFFRMRLKQLLAKYEDIWVSSLFYDLKEEKQITPKTKFTEMISNYEQFDFDLIKDKELLDIDFNAEKYFKSFSFLRFNTDLKCVRLSDEYNQNLQIFKSILDSKKYSLDKLDECLNYQSNKSLMFLGEFDELVRRYLENHLKVNNNIKNDLNIDEYNITFKAVSTKRAVVNHRLITPTGSKRDIGKAMSGKNRIGILAEQFTYKYLINDPTISNVKWISENAPIEVNANGRAGLGYDMSYEKNSITFFAEVKGTTSKNKKLTLQFSRNEIEFAKFHQDTYQILLCTDIKTKNPIIHLIQNFFIGDDFNISIMKDSFSAEPSGYIIYLEIE